MLPPFLKIPIKRAEIYGCVDYTRSPSVLSWLLRFLRPQHTAQDASQAKPPRTGHRRPKSCQHRGLLEFSGISFVRPQSSSLGTSLCCRLVSSGLGIWLLPEAKAGPLEVVFYPDPADSNGNHEFPVSKPHLPSSVSWRTTQALPRSLCIWVQYIPAGWMAVPWCHFVSVEWMLDRSGDLLLVVTV